MNKVLWVLLLLPFSLTAQKKFVISGNLQGLPEGSVVSLSDPNHPEDTLAKSEVRNGVFALNGSVEEPNIYQLNLDGASRKSVLFIGNDRVNVSGNVAAIENISISGSPIHDDFEEFKKIFSPLFQKLKEMGEKLNASPGVDKDDPEVTAYTAQMDKIKSEVDKFITAHRASPVSPFVVLITSEMEQDLTVLERRYNSLDKSAQNGFYGKIVKEQIDNNKAGEVGSEAIDFSQEDPDGKQVSLSSFKGKYVLVDFWASWCRPCRVENPNVVKAYNKFKDKNFTVLGVSLDNNRQPWLKAIQADKLVWTQVSDLKGWYNEAAAKYKIQSIPQNILVDPSGKIIAKNLRGPELQSRLSELLD